MVASELPLQTNVNASGDLHNYFGPAIEWSDGEAFYYFNGLEVTKEIALAKEYTKEDILGQVNADIRREMIAKIGIEKACEVLGADVAHEHVCAAGGKYELLMIDYLNDGVKRPYLKMQNPSLNMAHIEGVQGNTVEEALCFRNGLKVWVEPVCVS